MSTRSVLLRGDHQLPDGDYVELSVTDGGEGMTAEVLDRAFEPFFTTRETGTWSEPSVRHFAPVGGRRPDRSSSGAGTKIRLYLRKTEALPAELEAPNATRAHSVSETPGSRRGRCSGQLRFLRRLASGACCEHLTRRTQRGGSRTITSGLSDKEQRSRTTSQSKFFAGSTLEVRKCRAAGY